MRQRDGRPSFSGSTSTIRTLPTSRRSRSPPQFAGDPYHGEVAATDAALGRAAGARCWTPDGRAARSSSSRATTASRWASTARSRTASSPTRPRCACRSCCTRRACCRPRSCPSPCATWTSCRPCWTRSRRACPTTCPAAACSPRRRASGSRPRPATSRPCRPCWAAAGRRSTASCAGATSSSTCRCPRCTTSAEDPGERANLIARTPARREDLTAVLARLRRDDAGPVRGEESAETRQQLAALGYAAASSAPLKKHYTEEDDPKRLVGLDRLMQEVIARHRGGDLAGALAVCEEVVARRPDMTRRPHADGAPAPQARPAGARDRRAAPRVRDQPRRHERGGPAGLVPERGGRGDRRRRTCWRPTPRSRSPPLDVLTTRGAALAQLGRTARTRSRPSAARALRIPRIP